MSQPQETTALYKARQHQEQDRELDALLSRLNAEHGPRAEMTVRREPRPRRDPSPSRSAAAGTSGQWRYGWKMHATEGRRPMTEAQKNIAWAVSRIQEEIARPKAGAQQRSKAHSAGN